ncbi:DUF1905 domain-containing protein [Candidatus Kaiserbacteria bacterium]|nr:DUF1905 domain-containing protein [Candidatus Kaiserbacteria bacterium]MCB9812286.1 DUF1905 domain-containing protein [Candidatus Nomurabacteria bacterium]
MREKMFLWSTEGGAWHFLPVTKQVGMEIKETYGKHARGFGSLPVEVTIGKTSWRTSIFPEKTSGSYILPVKAVVRKNEGLEAGEQVRFQIRVRR